MAKDSFKGGGEPFLARHVGVTNPGRHDFDQNFVVLGGIEFNFLHLKGLVFCRCYGSGNFHEFSSSGIRL